MIISSLIHGGGHAREILPKLNASHGQRITQSVYLGQNFASTAAALAPQIKQVWDKFKLMPGGLEAAWGARVVI